MAFGGPRQNPMLVVSLLGAVFVGVSLCQTAEERCAAVPSTYLSFHVEETCTAFYKCAHGEPVRFPCPPGLHFSDEIQVCVWAYQYHDTCAMRNAERECAGSYTGVIGHPTQCDRFYDCYDPNGDYEKQCPPLTLFDIYQRKCVHAPQARCGPGRESPLSCLRSPTTTSCYLVLQQGQSWTSSLQACRDLGTGAYLAEINNEEENDFIKGNVYQPNTGIVWLGGSDLAENAVFRWESGSIVDYTDWFDGSYTEPDGIGSENSGHDCMAAVPGGPFFGAWGDATCSVGFQPLCEIS